MKGMIRDIFPGGNTPLGFFSYYSYILPQRKADRIFCIKGGPGVGKSTLMKELADIFVERGENVDRLWCSSDPDSLDGILLRGRNVAVVDGTAPHIIDPVNPGAVDEIVELGRFLDKEGLRKCRAEIVECGETISARFREAYAYLKRAAVLEEHIENIVDVRPYADSEYIAGIIPEAKASDKAKGEKRKFFATAITPSGIKECIGSLCGGIDNVFIIKASAGVRAEGILERISGELISSGFDVEEFYCPMNPASKLEHIASEEANLAVFTVNEYHGAQLDEEKCRIIFDAEEAEEKIKGFSRDIYSRMKKQRAEDIEEAVAALSEAKRMHDVLESYYIKNIDFKRIKKVKREIITKIG